MLSPLLLCLALAVGQGESAAASAVEPVPVVTVSAPPERWWLMQSLQGTYYGWLLDDNRMRVSGWTEAAFTASTAANEQLPLGLNYRANELLVHQHWLRFERTVVTRGTDDPTFGFRADVILPGSDYRFTLPRGLANGQLTANDGGPNMYGVDPIQLYAEAYFPTVGRGLDLKLGRFYSPFGVESVEALQTPFVSRSYAFFYDPFTHTGLLANLQCTEIWSVQAGIVAGCDVIIGDRAARATAVAGFKWAPPNGPDTVQFTAIVGPGRYDLDEQFNHPQVFDLVYTHKCNERTTYSLDALYGYQLGVPDIGTATWFAVTQYLTCALTPRMSATARLEFFDDIDGNRTGFSGLYTALTVGTSLRLTPALIVRPEVRYDYNTESRPFEDKHGLLTAATDVIVRW